MRAKIARTLLGERYFVSVFAFLSITAIIIISATYSFSRDRVIHNIASDINSNLTILNSTIGNLLRDSKRKVRFIYKTPPILGIARADSTQDKVDPRDGTPIDTWKSWLSNIFIAFIESNPDVKQIRYIGIANNGTEIVRVDRRDGNILRVDDSRLQSKAGTEYFKATTSLNPNEFYVSDISLNREYGRVEYPIWPTYRISTPVFSEDNKVFGLVVINFDANHLIRTAESSISNNLDLIILSKNSDIIKHPNLAYQFGLDKGTGISWDATYQKVKESPYFDTYLDLISNKKLHAKSIEKQLIGGNSKRILTIISGAPEERYKTLLASLLMTSILPLLVIYTVVILLFYFFHKFTFDKVKLSNQLAQFQSIIAGTQDAVISTDLNGRIKSWNRSAVKIFGYNAQEARYLKIYNLVPESEQEILRKKITQAATGDLIPLVEVRAKRSDDNIFFTELTISPTLHQDGQITGISIIARDVSDKKEYENRILELNVSLEEKVRERTIELEEAKDRALIASQEKSSFVANISHEIRTPMNGIFGMLSLLRRTGITEKQDHFLSLAENSVSTLTNLINDVLDYSKIESGKLDIESIEFNILDSISAIASTLSIKAYEKDLEIVTDLSGIKIKNVIGDPYRLHQIVTNIVSNAIKFTDEGEIFIRCRTVEKSDQVEFHCAVEDDGIGINEEKQKALFEAFTQADSSITRKYGGTGLGLSISKHLCQLMDGDIGIEKSDEQGTTFEFHICLEKSASQDTPANHQELIDQKIVFYAASHRMLQSFERHLNQEGFKHYFCIEIEDAQWEKDTHYLEADAYIIDDSLRVPIVLNAIHESAKNVENTAIIVLQKLGGKSFDDPQKTYIKSLIKPINQEYILKSIHRLLNTQYFQTEIMQGSENEYSHKSNPLSKFQGCTVMIVDDNEINQEVAMGVLNHYGIHSVCADNGLEAISKLTQTPEKHCAVILMDCQMPIMDGFTATKKIREGAAGDKLKDIPIIALTAGVMTGEREKCTQAGMSDFLAKPIQVDIFESVVTKQLEVASKLNLLYIESELVNQTPIEGNPIPAESKPIPPAHHISPSEATDLHPTSIEANAAPQTNGHNDLPSINEFNDIEVWDKKDALQRMLNDEKMLKKLIDIFIGSTKEKVNNVLSLLHSLDDFLTLSQDSHYLKGVSGNIGATRLYQICKVIEEIAQNNPSILIDNKPLAEDYATLIESTYSQLVNILQESYAESA